MTDAMIRRDARGYEHVDADHVLECDACLEAFERIVNALETAVERRRRSP